MYGCSALWVAWTTRGGAARRARPATIEPRSRIAFLYSESVQPRRIVDQDFPLQLGLGRHLREEVDQVPIVRHVFADIGMRPVGAPEDAIRRGFNQPAREGHGVGEGRPFR